MVRADFITSIVLLVLGLAIVEESWRMPRYTDVNSSIWSAPGMVPGMLGVALAVMATILLLRSVAARRAAAGPGDAPSEGGWGRVATAVGLCVLYAGVLVGRMPFWLATFLFVFAFIAVFEWTDPEARARWVRRGLMALAVAIAAAVAIPYVFQSIFLVRLP